MYTEKVMEHFTNPRNVGELVDANAVGEVGNAQCGDIMKIYMRINEDTNVIESVSFKTFGCGAAIATSSMATELVQGRTVDEALEITNTTVAEALDGLPPAKMHCSNLAQEAIQAAISNYLANKGIDPATLGIVGCSGCCQSCHGHHHED